MEVFFGFLLFWGFTITIFGTRRAYKYLSQRSINKIIFVTVIVCSPVILWYWLVLTDVVVLRRNNVEETINYARSEEIFNTEEIDISKSAFRQFHETLRISKREDFARILGTDFEVDKKALADFRDILNKTIGMSTRDNMMMTVKNTKLGDEDITHKDIMNLQEDKLTRNVLTYLPKESLLPAAPYKVCSVVGNGAILSGSNCGNQIDRADMIFRFNLAPTIGGFEKDVGRKTNVTTTSFTALLVEYGNIKNPCFEKFYDRLKSERGIVWYPGFFNSVMSRAALRVFLRLKEMNADHHRIVLSGFNHFKAVEHFWRQSFGFQRKLTTEFYFVTSAITLCEEVNVYGFWWFGRSPDDAQELRIHYYDNSSSFQSDDYDLLKEMQGMAVLHKHGVIKAHINGCNNVI